MTRDGMDERLDEEVRFHIDMQTERNIKRGMTPDEARRQALVKFGGRERWKEEARAEYHAGWFDGLRNDLVFAMRALRQNPAFTATAIATLALGIGASTAIFSVVNTVLLRPLPYRQADQLVLVWGDMRARKVTDFPFSPPNFWDLKKSNTSFQDIAGLSPQNVALTMPGEPPEQVSGMAVTTNLLTLLGARVAYGRNFIESDGEAPPPPPQPAPGAPPQPQAAPQQPPLPFMVVLNNPYWRRRFGGDTSVIGKTIDIGGNPAQIVGILAPGFEVLFPPNTHIEPNPDVIGALRIDYQRSSRLNVFLRVVGRLKPGVSLVAARADAERAATAIRDIAPIFKAADIHYRVEPMHDDLVTDVRPAIFALMGAVVFVLLIACANVANLLLVRAAAREREIAVRSALGSSAWRIVRQLLSESILLSLGGALFAIGLTWVGIKLLVFLSPENIPRLGEVKIDLFVLVFATLAAITAAALFGTVPALRASRPDLADVLRAAGRTPGLSGGKLLRSGVVVAEVALSFVLLVGGGLMMRSFIQLSRINPGFEPRGLLKFNVQGRNRTPQQLVALKQEMRDKLGALPGVTAVTAVSPLPLDGQLINSRVGKEDAVTDPTKFQQANLHIVLPGYFETMGTKVIEGRTFTQADDRPENTFVVIDDLMAANAFPGESAIGKRLFVRSRGQEAEWITVIGVVQHQRHDGLATPGPQAIFLPDGYFGHGAVATWVVRTSCAAGSPCNPMRLASAVRRVVGEVDPQSPVADLDTVQSLVDKAMTSTRFALVMLGIFAGVAAVLACVGLYGVLATAVRQRTAEIGVRVAFGASKSRIFGLVVRDGMKLSILGLVVGVVASFWLTKAMTTMLIGVERTDMPTYIAIFTLFLAIAVVACLVPARRAAALDPTNALRSE